MLPGLAIVRLGSDKGKGPVEGSLIVGAVKLSGCQIKNFLTKDRLMPNNEHVLLERVGKLCFVLGLYPL